MSSAREWRFRITHILEAIAKIRRYTSGQDEAAFRGDEKTVDAVIRNFQVIGEASRLVPAEIQSASPHIPWPQMQKMRHVLVHDYDKVDIPTVWQTIQQDLPPLVEPLQKLLAVYEPNEP